MKQLIMAALALLSTNAAFAATPGVNDFVTDIRVGVSEQCLRFQTANSGGNTVGTTTLAAAHTWNPAAVSFGVPFGNANGVSDGVATVYIAGLTNSLWTGSSTGPFIQFTDMGPYPAGSDCTTDLHIPSPLDQ